MHVKKILLAVLMLSAFMGVHAQFNFMNVNRVEQKAQRIERINELMRRDQEGETVFHKHSVFGIQLVSDGYGFTYEYGKFINNKKTLLFQAELNERKHPKENKLSFTNRFGSANLIYGKLNNFYQSRWGIAQQTRIGGKTNKNGVSVAGIFGGGLSIGLLRPYMMDVKFGQRIIETTFDQVPDTMRTVRFLYPQNGSVYEAPGYIYGSSGITSGWTDIKINPGLYTKAAMRFDYGRFNESVAALEIGLSAEAYSKKVAQMAYVAPQRFFFSSYISILFGSRK